MSERAADPPTLFDVPAAPGQPIGRRLTLFESGGQRAVFFGTTTIHVYDAADKQAEAACIATLSRAGLASDVDIAAGFGIHRNTVGRLVSRFERNGMAAVVAAKRGPKGPSKVTPEVTAIIAASAHLRGRDLQKRIAEATGVSLSLPYVYELAVAYRARQLELTADEEAPSGTDEPEDTAVADGATDEPSPGGDGTDAAVTEGATVDEVSLAAVSDETTALEPPAILPEKARGPYMGLALYYPALAALGLVDVARSVFGLPRSERFGVRAVTLTLLFLTLLGKGTVESAKHLRRVAFGAVAGSGRAPAVKTLRRKLVELVGQRRAAEFGTRLARRWVQTGIVATAYLYVDGHMQVYSGKRRLQQVWNSQRRMPLPGVHTYHVADANGRPLLFLTEQLSANLAKAMPRVIAAIRAVLDERPFTVVFDRGGYDGKLFSWLDGEHISFITYQKGSPALPADAFKRRETRFEGRRVRFPIAEDEVTVGRRGPWRRIVMRTADGHQTPILTNLGPEVGAARIPLCHTGSCRMDRQRPERPSAPRQNAGDGSQSHRTHPQRGHPRSQLRFNRKRVS
ncbi:MAG: putative transposase [Egibacteraceae bacterium]